MDTPEKMKILETVRELKREAEEKLTGNRHYLAIQKLDEIAEAIEKRNLSEQDLGTIGGVLDGNKATEGKAVQEPVPAQETGPDETSQTNETVIPEVTLAGTAAAGLAAASQTEVVSTPTATAEVVSDQAVEQSEISRVPADTTGNDILPNWWKTDRQAASSVDAPVENAGQGEVAASQETGAETPETAETAVEEEHILRVSEAATAPVSQAKAQQETPPETEADQPATVDLSTIAAGAAAVTAGVAATGIAAGQSEDEVVEVTKAPSAEAVATGEELSAVPEAGKIELIEEPAEIVEVVETQTIVREEVVLVEPDAPDPQAVVEETVVEETVVTPEISPAAVEEVAPQAVTEEVVPPVIVEEDVVVETVSEELAPVEEAAPVENDQPDGSMQVAAVAAGAAAATVAVASSVSDAALDQVPETAAPQPVVDAPGAPEKLSFPEVPAEEAAPATEPKARILDASDINSHPDYSGNRGGFIKRFFNALKGKDYI